MVDEKPMIAENNAKGAPPASAEKQDGEVAPKKVIRRVRRSIPAGRVYVSAGFNNTIVSITDPDGKVLAWHSAGASGFNGTKKSTPYAAQVAAETVSEKAKAYGMEAVEVFVSGVGPGREQALRALAKSFSIDLIVDRTSTPHNGCRKRKGRRV